MASRPALQLESLRFDQADGQMVSNDFSADYIIFSSLFAHDAIGIEQIQQQLKQSLVIARQFDIPFVFLSNARVFESGREAAYSEAEVANALEDYGQSIWLMEQLVRDYPQHIILRTGDLLGSVNDRVWISLSEVIQQQKTVDFCQYLGFAPTHYEDLARVLLAIMLQLPNQARSRFGTFHYTSAEVTSEQEFVQVLLSVLALRDKRYDDLEFAIADAADLDGGSAVLKCDKLLHTFGVKQRPWRTYLAQLSEVYLTSDNA